MSLIANLGINLDTRDAAAKLRQFVQGAQAAGRAAEQLQGSTASLASSFAKQQGSTATLAAKLRALKGEYANLAAAAKASAKAGGEGFSESTIARLRTLSAQIKSTRESFIASKTAASQLRGEMDALGSSAEGASSRFKDLAGQAATALAGLGVGRLAQGITRTAANFDAELRKAAAIEGGGNFEKLRKDIESVASVAAGTPTEVAQLATALSRAGFSAKETGESLRGIVLGAEATAVTFEQMGTIAADAMRSFGLQTSETGRVVDVLVKTANSSNQSVLDLGEAFKYSAPTAKALGVTIEDLSGVMGLLANAGIRGSTAGTSLSTGLSRLQLAASGSRDELIGITNGSAELEKAMKALGSEVLTAEGKLKPLDDVLIAMKRSFDQLNIGQRVEITKALFGEEAGRSFQTLLSGSEESIRKMVAQVNNAQGAADTTREAMRGFSDSVKVLGGNVEILTNAIGDKFAAVLKPAVDLLNDLISASQKLPQPVRDAAAALAAAGLAAGSLTLSLKAVIPLIRTAATALGFQGLAGAATAAQGAMVALLPLLGRIAAIGVITIGLKFAIEGADEFLTGQMGAAQADRLARDMAERRGLTYTPSKAVQRRFAAASAYKSPFAGARDEAFRRAQLITGEPAAAVTRPSAVPPATTGTKGAAAEEGPKDTSAELQEQIKRFREQADIQNRIRDLQFQGRERLAAEAQLEAEILQINYDRNDALKAANFEGERRNINALAESKIIDAQAKAADQIREINNRRFQEELQNQQAVRDAAKTISSVREQQEMQFKNAEEYRMLLQNGLLPAEAQRILNFQNLVKEELKALDAQIDIAKAAYLEAESRGAARSELAKEIELLERKRKAVEDAAAAGPGRGETDLDRINAGATAAQEKLNELTNLGNIVVTSANNIGNAFGEAFNKLVTGAGSAKQVLSDFFQSVAQGFFKMAQEIIAQTLIMITLQAILKALGGATGGGDSGSTTNMADVGSYADSTSSIGLGDFPLAESAKGNAFTPQGPVERYAKGGIVNAPTLFRYAKGGTFAPGLMGEAGPEAILPLRRTPDGRLGVTQVRSPQDADRMREMMGRSPAQQQAPMLNLKFETTTINGVEYVSREQLEVAMTETRKRASKEGAERGMSMTLDKMRNSPRTRAQVGMR